jgi:fimbrial chaperone protein
MKPLSLDWKKKARNLLAFFSICISVATANAANLSVYPLRVEFTGGKTGDALNLRNAGSEPILVQASVVKWSQKDGADQFEPTKEVLVAPALVEIPAGDTQVVRLALRRTADASAEQTYRLLLREVPRPVSANGPRLQIVVNISLPVFVPATSAASTFSFESSTEGGNTLVLRNAGSSHIQFKELDVSDASGKTVNYNTMFYMLGQQTRKLELPATTKLGTGPWQIKAKTDRGDLTSTTTAPR